MPKSRRKRAQKASQPLQQSSASLTTEPSVAAAAAEHNELTISTSQHDKAAYGKERLVQRPIEEARITAQTHGHSYEGMTIGGASRNHFGDHYGVVTNIFGSADPLPGSDEGKRHTEAIQLAKERQLEGDKRIAFLKALEFDGMGSRVATIGRAQVDTCDWIIKTPQYIRWRDESIRNEHHGILWMKRKPGAGKSTLMKHFFDIAKERDCSETIVSFFFDARGWPLEKSTEGMYRCLLHQILEGLPHLYSSKTLATQRSWSIGALKNIFHTVLVSLGPLTGRIACYIDALDECTQDEVRDAVEFFEELCDFAVSHGIQFSICLSSRHYPHISMHKYEEFRLDDQYEHLRDISIYLQSQLNRLRISSSSVKAEIETDAQRRCSGVFLWVVLIMKILREEYDHGTSHSDLLASVRRVPDGIHELLASILGEPEDDMISAFKWVLFAKRPLTLEELYFAIKASTGSLWTGEWDTYDLDKETMRRFLLRSTRGLVEVTEQFWRSETRFIHESVRQHLLAGGLASLTVADENTFDASTHAQLAQWCLSYVELDSSTYSGSLQLDRLGFEIDEQEFYPSTFPLLKYAWKNVFHHMEIAQAGGIVQIAFLETFPLKLWIIVSKLLRRRDTHSPLARVASSAILLYFTVAHRCFELTKVLLRHAEAPAPLGMIQTSNIMFDINAVCSGWRGRVLDLALDFGGADFVRLLLDHGANTYAPYEIETYTLINAVQTGDTDIVELLLQRGAKVNTREWSAPSALSEAAYAGSCQLVPLLLDCTPLEAAIAEFFSRGSQKDSNAHYGVVQLLLAHGAEVNVWSRSHGSPLWLAASNAGKDMMELLLEYGAEMDPRDKELPATALYDLMTMPNIESRYSKTDKSAGEAPTNDRFQIEGDIGRARPLPNMLPNRPDCHLQNVYGDAMNVAFIERNTAVARLFWNAMFPSKALSHECIQQALNRQNRTKQLWSDTQSENG